ncbi:MAG TPA: hypothetical protein VGK30_01670 [Candidatus Binatia bacterium]|jgi:hypothetical protein
MATAACPPSRTRVRLPPFFFYAEGSARRRRGAVRAEATQLRERARLMRELSLALRRSRPAPA